MADKVKILSVNVDIGQAQQKLGELTNAMGVLKNQKAKLDKQMRQGKELTRAQQIEYANLRKQIKSNQVETKKYANAVDIANGSMSKTSGFVMGIRKALTGMAAQFLGVMAAFALIKNVIGTFKDFEQANADLASVLGKTIDDIKELTEDAKRLGAVTAFTATEVSQLQKEFAKLGFSTDEILDATEATLNLAAATNTDLARAAEVAGSTVRAFGMDASETKRVTDVMAKSFSSSALDMEKFATSMRGVAPVAKNAGLNIEQTTSMLGVLVDRGVDASTAGTSLRNVFLELSKKGLTFEEAMRKINDSTDKNKTSLELFGKRGAVTGTILSQTADDAARLEEKLNNAGGAAEAMAETQLDTLQGKLTLLNSAWEGFILSVESGEGALGSFLKNTIDGMTELLNIVTDLSKTEEELIEREGGELAKASLVMIDEKKTLQGKYNQALIITNRAEKDLVQNQEILKELEEERAKRQLTKTQQDLKDLGWRYKDIAILEEKIELQKQLVSKNKQIIDGASKIIDKKKFEIELDGARKMETEALIALAGQENEAARIALAERVKATEGEAEAEQELTKEEKRELEKRNKQREKAEADRLKLEEANAKLRLQIASEEAQRKAELSAKEFEDAKKRNKANIDAILEQMEVDAEIRLLDAEVKDEERLALIDKENAEFQTKLNGIKIQDNATEAEKKLHLSRIEALEKQHKDKVEGVNKKFDDIDKKRRLDTLSATANLIGTLGTLAKEGSAAQKILTSAQAVINTYSAAVAAIAAPPIGYGPTPIGYIAMASAIASGLANVAKINSVKFADGGVLRGKSHARGGIPTMDGQYEFEGGEAVINKRSTARYGALLSHINQAGGGVSFGKGGVTKFQDGGLSAPSMALSDIGDNGANDITQEITSQVGAIKVVNVVSETTDAQNSILNVQSEAEIG